MKMRPTILRIAAFICFLVASSLAYGQGTGLPNDAPALPSNLYSTPSYIGATGSGTSNATAAAIYTTNLIGYYQALPGETAAALKDYSGAGNNATGTTGTAPTLIANTGGLQCGGAGAVQLPTALNSAVTIQIMYGYQPSGISNGIYSPVIAAGTPATNGVGIGIGQGTLNLSVTVGASALSNNIGSLHNNFGAGNQLYDVTPSYDAGIMDVTLVMGATDVMYINGLAPNLLQSAGSLSSVANGPYQLCGAAAGQGLTNATFMTGQVYMALFYSGALNAAQVYQNHVAMQNALLARGIIPNSFRTDTADAIWSAGDSTTAGNGFIAWPNRVVGLSSGWNPINRGISGVGAATLNTTAPAVGDSICSTAGGRTALVLLTGANDTVTATAFGNARGFLVSRKFPNCSKPVTMLSTMMDNLGAMRLTYNPLVRTSCQNGIADYCIDLGGTIALGATSAANSAVYFQVNHLHPTQAGADVIAWVFQRGINRSFGNHGPSTANTYGSAATAAVAVTAASETGNVMTFTTAANTYTAGQCIIVAGVTPTTYNSTFANSAGLGCWYALTVSATSFTAFNQNTGIGVLTVAGTASVPQMQDADQYYMVNFGAGNTTLESCEGLMDTDVQYIQNINAAGSTLVPFGSQTITGAGTTALAANTTAVLRPQLISQAAGGCNWLRIQ